MTPTVAPNILVVDDSSTTRSLLRKIISMSRLPTNNIYEAADGQQGLDVIASNPVDIVLADLHMPGMDGEEMSRRIFADPKCSNIAVIIVSADPNEKRIQSLLSAGAKGYLPKPFAPEAFRKVMSNLIGKLAA